MSERTSQVDDLDLDDEAEIEARARAQGWKPKSEYRGDAAHWKPAAEYLQYGEERLPVLRERQRVLEDRLAEARRRDEAQLQMMADLSERVRTSEERGYRRAQQELQEKKRAAIEMGDTSAVAAVEAEMAELATTAPKPVPKVDIPQETPTPPPEVAHWMARNPWFSAFPDLAKVADTLHLNLLKSDPGLSVAENLDRVTELMQGLYPDKVRAVRAPGRSQMAAVQDDEPDPPRRSAAPVSSAREGAPRSRNARIFANLPDEAKAQFARYAGMFAAKPGFKPLTEQEWADTYYAEEDRSA